MEYMEKAEQYLVHTYNRFNVVIDKAKGVYVYDVNGKKYLDFASGRTRLFLQTVAQRLLRAL